MDTFATYNKKLAGYKDVSETVKIIEKIAAGQLHNLEQKTKSLADYTNHILSILSRLNQFSNNQPKETLSTLGKTLLIIFTGDKGLVGDLWRRLFDLHTESSQQDIFVFGKKGQQHWPKSIGKVSHYSFANRIPNSRELYSLSALLTSYIDEKVYSTVSTLHLYPVSLVEQNSVLTQLLPINIPDTEFTDTETSMLGYPIIDSSSSLLQKNLFEKYLSSRLQQVILETAVSEYSSRTVAMEYASTKTDDVRERLSMVYSRDRRQRETQKQLERFTSRM